LRVEIGETIWLWAIDLMGEITKSTEFDREEEGARQVIALKKNGNQ
jgi:hypothetical protein